MSSFDQEHQHDIWEERNKAAPNEDTSLHIDFRAMTIQAWTYLSCVWAAKLTVAVMMAASFAGINPVADDVYLANFIPLPTSLEDITMNAVINMGLGLATVLIPTALWKHILSDEFHQDPKSYFRNNPIRIAVGVVLTLAYLLMITLEILALRARINVSLDTGPIGGMEAQPEALPMVIASMALILGTALLGLASASLSKSIARNFGTYQ